MHAWVALQTLFGNKFALIPRRRSVTFTALAAAVKDTKVINIPNDRSFAITRINVKCTTPLTAVGGLRVNNQDLQDNLVQIDTWGNLNTIAARTGGCREEPFPAIAPAGSTIDVTIQNNGGAPDTYVVTLDGVDLFDKVK